MLGAIALSPSGQLLARGDALRLVHHEGDPLLLDAAQWPEEGRMQICPPGCRSDDRVHHQQEVRAALDRHVNVRHAATTPSTKSIPLIVSGRK